MDDREMMNLLFPEEECDNVDKESDIVENEENEETDISDHNGHRLRLRRQITMEGFDGVSQRDLLELMLYSVQPRQDVNIVCNDLLEDYGSLRRLLKSNAEEFSRFESLGDDGVYWMDGICALARMCNGMVFRRRMKIANFSQLRRYAQNLLLKNKRPCCFQLLTDSEDHLLFQRKIAPDLRWGESSSLACAADDAFSLRAQNGYLLVFTDHPSAHPSTYDQKSLCNYSMLLKHSDCRLRDILFMNEKQCISMNRMHMINNLFAACHRMPGSIAEDEDLPVPEGGLIVHRVSQPDV